MGKQWEYEVKFDGYRIEALKDGLTVCLLSRRGNDFTKRFAKVAEAVSTIKADSVLIDGEVVAVDEKGRPSFQVLQNRAKIPAKFQLVYYAFDLLHLNGEDLRRAPLKERRARLEKIVKGTPVRFSSTLEGPVDVVTAAVRKHGMEGIVAKRLDSLYESGERSDAWRKLPLKPRQEFVIGGYRPEGKSLELLLVGYYAKEQFLFAGKVRMGLNPSLRALLAKGLQPLVVKACPFANLPNSKKGHWGEGVTAEEMGNYVWLRPVVVAEIKFTEWTEGDVLRHPEFVGIREDKEAKEVRRES